ncbi:acyl-CoA N-acyltransferase [Paraphaeosphaeria sporulosa]|uniref:Acyl-CoA N-acyltransferase n=1 Tax=Paraphaeosphaeria sporulosa TaxID=1460663 RepID=A0A177C1N1_9PLEO|nr:acyl-CoA N-acyltransferase [Paraphaeosphaeria sporulosa]OAG01405.1 acyl-CoA N-acyltransferase [Paraphaeosphaeria sporulosa]
MPRDLLADKKTLEGMPPLSKEPAADSPEDPHPMPSLYQVPTSFVEDRFKRMTDLHPFASLLNQDDLDDCDWLEHAAFDESEAASREKVGPVFAPHSTSSTSPWLIYLQIAYRLTVCGELCSGLFSSAYPTVSGPLSKIIKARKEFPSVDSADSDRKRILMGHIIATKFKGSNVVTDDAMAYPSDWKTNYQLTPSTGHNEDGDTICLHSLCVHPDLNGKGLGGVLLRSWTQRMKDAGLGKRVALICRERFVKFYESAGFEKVGASACQYGGGGWIDMVMEFDAVNYDDDVYP